MATLMDTPSLDAAADGTAGVDPTAADDSDDSDDSDEGGGVGGLPRGTELYGNYRRLLQLRCALSGRPVPARGHLVLKSPHHTCNLPAIVAAFAPENRASGGAPSPAAAAPGS